MNNQSKKDPLSIVVSSKCSVAMFNIIIILCRDVFTIKKDPFADPVHMAEVNIVPYN